MGGGHNFLSESLRTLQAGSRLTGTKHRNVCLTQSISHACYQWRLRAHHHQVSPHLTSQGDYFIRAVGVNEQVSGDLRSAGVTWRYNKFSGFRITG